MERFYVLAGSHHAYVNTLRQVPIEAREYIRIQIGFVTCEHHALSILGSRPVVKKACALKVILQAGHILAAL
jgi:hypothetical protein